MPIGSNKMGLYRGHLGGAGVPFQRQISITPTISNYDSAVSYGSGYQNKLDYSITSNLPNATLNYELNGASNAMFANGVVTGSFTTDSSGVGSLTYDMNVWANYSATSTNLSLSLYGPNGNVALATSSNIVFSPANTVNATSSNVSTLNGHTVHIYDSYETINSNTYAIAKTWDDLQITSLGEVDSPLNKITAIVVGGGGAGGMSYTIGSRNAIAGGGGGGTVVYYQAPANVYSLGNISVTLGSGGRMGYSDSANLAKGGNTVFGFHETTSNIIAYGGSGSGHYGGDDETPTTYLGNVVLSLGQGGYADASTPANANVFGGSGAGNVENNLGDYHYKGAVQANLTTVGSYSTVFVGSADGGLDTNPGGGLQTNVVGGQGGPGGNTTIFETATTGAGGAQWTVIDSGTDPFTWGLAINQYTSGIKVPQPLISGGNVQTSPAVTYWTVAGGGASAIYSDSANIGNISNLYSGSGGSEFASSGNANTSFAIESGARVAPPVANVGSQIYHGIRGGGGGSGQFSRFVGNVAQGGGHGGEGVVIVYYPTEYMAFTS